MKPIKIEHPIILQGAKKTADDLNISSTDNLHKEINDLRKDI